MKHKIVILACILVLAGLGVLMTAAIHSQAVKDQLNQSRIEASQAANKKLHEAIVASEEQRVRSECQKGLVAYNALTPAQKVGKTAPQCNLELVE